jgi:2-polyprenyl-3-methyl-5-hydroxy-6-metoxy-1,4-benzoquinol methylase
VPIQLDPEDTETNALLDCADFTDKRVLEIGCGDGRLTWRCADRAAQVIAIDPVADRIEAAIKDTPAHLKDRVEFQAGSIEEFQPPKDLFDCVFLSWSLC